MTSRQKGQRVPRGALRKTRHCGSGKAGRREDAALGKKDRRQLIQLVICSSFFVLLVAVKLGFPEYMAKINGTLSAALEKNIDVQTVFSAVGRAFSDQSSTDNAADEVYRAVFHPDRENNAGREVNVRILETDGAFKALQKYRMREIMTVEPEGKEISTEEETAVSTLSYVLYSDRNLPENVSLEQPILNFEYCTPVMGTISSPFGYREHPVAGEERFHYGLDLAANTGTEVRCFADGVVTAVGESSSYGKYCMVSHDGNYTTLYAHCSRIFISSGENVNKGEKIAEVGETGIATGPHLHFELHQDGIYLNPIYYVTSET